MKRPSLPLVAVLVLVTAFVGFYAGEVHQARLINAEIEAAFALPLPCSTPAPLSTPAALTLNP